MSELVSPNPDKPYIRVTGTEITGTEMLEKENQYPNFDEKKQKNSASYTLYRGDKLDYGIRVEKAIYKYVSADTTVKDPLNSIFAPNKRVAMESFSTVENNGKDPILYVSGMPQQFKPQGKYTTTPQGLIRLEEAQKSENSAYNSTSEPARRVYIFSGGFANSDPYQDYKITSILKPNDGSTLEAHSWLLVRPQKDKYEPKSNEKTYELNYLDELSGDTVKDDLKFDFKQSGAYADRPLAGKTKLPQGANVTIDETSLPKNPERGKTYPVTVKIHYADDTYDATGNQDPQGGHSTDTTKVNVVLKQFAPSYEPVNGTIGKPATSTPTFKNSAKTPEGATFSLPNNAPAGAQIDPATGKVTYTPTDQDENKTITIPVLVTYKDKTVEHANATINVGAQEQTPAPSINKVTAGDKKITGKSTPNAHVTVTLPNGQSVETTADKDGNFSVNVPENVELKKDDVVKATAQEDGKKISPEATAQVLEKTVDNGSENNGSENNGSESNGSENNGSESNGSENNGSENNGSENNGSENNGSESNGSESNGSESNGSESNGSESNGSENNGSENNGKTSPKRRRNVHLALTGSNSLIAITCALVTVLGAVATRVLKRQH